MDFSSLLSPVQVKQLAEIWLKEDLPSFDVGGFIVGDCDTVANLYCKQNCTLAGVPFFTAVFELLQCKVQWLFAEGSLINEVPCIIAHVYGPARKILLGERPSLNCISRASGISTQVAKFVRLAKEFNWNGHLAATRKTTPGFRMVEKYAVLVGGSDPHRYDLSSMVMLKDNHITACNGDIAKAIKMAKCVAGFSLKVEVEARTHDEALKASENNADIVMLDNFSADEAKKTSKVLKASFPSVIIEVSGGVNEKNLPNYFSSDIDVISLGILTQGYSCVDFSLKL